MAKRITLRRALVVMGLAFVCAEVQLAAQDKPDFSGSWVLESGAQAAPEIPQSMSVNQTLERTNVRGGVGTVILQNISIKRDLEGGTRSDMYRIGLMGGAVAGLSAGIRTGTSTHFRVVWAEQALVIETGSYTGEKPESGEWTERREIWSLEPDGRLRLAITTRSSVEDSRTVILVYRRQ